MKNFVLFEQQQTIDAIDLLTTVLTTPLGKAYKKSAFFRKKS